MQALIQNYSTGSITLEEIPLPKVTDNQILVRNIYSVVSIGTEASMVKLAKKSIIGKALARPDLVRRVFQKLSQTSIAETAQIVRNKLDTPINLGYSASGIVEEIGSKVSGYKKGDYISFIGSGLATHSEYNLVPVSMCSKINEENLRESSFGMLGCIAMHAVRQFRFNLNGKKVAILGSGLLGNIATQILNAYGAETFSYDPSEVKSDILRDMGFNSSSKEDALHEISENLKYGGFDGVLLACAVNNNGPLQQALDIIRINGEIVVMGVVDIKLDRNEMWQKQASIIVSKAGGFGALDENYYSSSENYSLDSTQWTEKNNLDEINRLIKSRKIDFNNLITSEIKFNDAVETYENLISGKMHNELGIIFSYDVTKESDNYDFGYDLFKTNNNPTIGIIGVGNHAVSNFLPELKKIKQSYNLKTLATKTPIKAKHYAKKFGFINSTCDKNNILNDKDINHVISLERHSDHFSTIKKCIREDKNILIEKPLIVSREEYNQLLEILKSKKQLPKIMVGHNRRHIESVIFLKKQINTNRPGIINMTINAGKIETNHWLYNENEGGNRIIAEGSHFIDLIKFLTDSSISSYKISSISSSTYLDKENFIVSFNHENGFLTNLMYTSFGSRNSPREIIEVFQNGNHLTLTDFKKYQKNNSTSYSKKFSYDLGFKRQIESFINPSLNHDSKISIKEEIDTIDMVLKISETIGN